MNNIISKRKKIMAEIICGIYKIVNTITNDFYIGSSKNVKQRWSVHKCPSYWSKHPNNPLYLDMKKYGTDKFEMQILAEVEADKLKEKEQWFIELLKPTYNDRNAKGWDFERRKESLKSDKRKEYQKEYKKSERYKDYQKEYKQSDKWKEYQKEYNNKFCLYNNETITLCALSMRFKRAGIEHPVLEAKKYLLTNSKDK